MIRPDEIIALLKNVPTGFPVEHYIIARIEARLPQCKQRAIAAIHCSMIDPEYKKLCDLFTEKHNYNLHQKFKLLLAEINKRR
jgi:hypothetical protein